MNTNSSKEFYVVITNSDLTEGRGYELPIGVADNIVTARRYSREAGVQGCDADVRTVVAFQEDGVWYFPKSCVHTLTVSAADRREVEEMRKAVEVAAAKEAKLAEMKEKILAAGLDWEDVARTFGM